MISAWDARCKPSIISPSNSSRSGSNINPLLITFLSTTLTRCGIGCSGVTIHISPVTTNSCPLYIHSLSSVLTISARSSLLASVSLMAASYSRARCIMRSMYGSSIDMRKRSKTALSWGVMSAIVVLFNLTSIKLCKDKHNLCRPW